MLVFAGFLQPAWTMVRGTTELGQPFVTGGVGADEIDTLNREKAQYALAILTAAKGSGAFLADVHIRITDAKSKQVLDSVMDGPWLLVDLPAGRYLVEAVLNSRVQKSVVTLGAGDHRQTAFYFDVPGEVQSSSP